jgi:hypothetical protein
MTNRNEPWGGAARRHEIPTHLDVEDRLLFGLPARRALALLGGLAIAFSLWHQWPALPEAQRAGLAAACVLVAAVQAFVRPGGRGLEAWALVAARYAARPRASVWRPSAPEEAARLLAPADAAPSPWEELAPRLAWDPVGLEVARACAPEAREVRPWAS